MSYQEEKLMNLKDGQLLLKTLNEKKADAIDMVDNTPAETKTFSGGADNMAIKVQAGINLVQDLHGYSSPWIGGTGKNLFDAEHPNSTSSAGVTYAYNSDGSFTLSGDANAEATLFFFVLPKTIPSGSTVSFSLNNNTTNSEVGIRLVKRENGTITQWGNNPIYADSVNKTYTYNGTGYDANEINLFVKTGHGDVPSITLKVQIELGSTPTTWEPYANVCPIYGWTGCNITRSGEGGSNPTVYSIGFPQDPGTVYSGTLTVNKDGSGVLLVDTAYYEFNSDTTYTAQHTAGSEFWYIQSDAFDTTNNSPDLLTSAYKTVITPETTINGTARIVSKKVTICDDRFTSSSAIHDVLEVMPIQAVVPLVNAVVCNFTAQQIRSVFGINNLSANTGDILSVEYPVDTKTYVNVSMNSKADKEGTILTTTLSRGRKNNTTVGTGSFAFGNDVESSGFYSHAEGETTIASGQSSHAEGVTTIASNYGAHSEGVRTTASGVYSHAEGAYSIANHRSQHVFGEYNIEDPSLVASSTRGNYIEIVGNGTGTNAANRSNGRTLDWNGNERLKGDLYVNCNADSTGGTKVISLPTLPTTNGTYKLQCVISGGTPTLSWVVE